jgi:hypothetical protein
MARVGAHNDNLPAFSAGSLEAFVAWLHASREHIRSQKIASFLAVAQKGKLRTEDGSPPSTNSGNIRDLGRILNTTLAVPTSDGMMLTEDGQMLASLFGQFADFVAACHGKPYQWRIGGADTAIQWLISPIIPKIYEEMSKQAGISLDGKQHQKAVKLFFRTGRTEALVGLQSDSAQHVCSAKKGATSTFESLK